MFRTVGDQASLWESVLPEELLRLPEELARVDALLDDPAFFAPFVPFFDPRMGRPSTPMETYLRLMFLKFRYRLGYESLCREVADSITWRRFCRIPLDGSVPHPTTLMKLTTRCGSAAVDGLNEALLAKAAEAKLLRTNRIRVDTTVVPANVCLPDRLGPAGQGDPPDRGDRQADPGRGWRDAHQGAGPVAVRPGKRAHAIAAQAADPLRGRPRRGAGRGAAGHRRAGRAGRDRRRGRRAAAGQRQAGAAPGPGQGRRSCAGRGERDAAAGRRRGRLARAVNDLDRAAGRDPADRGADPAAVGRDHPGRGDAAGQPARRAMPARSPRAGWASRSSSGTRPRSSTTTTGSCWTTPSSRATRADAPQLAPAVARVDQARRAHAAHRHRRPRLRRSQASTTSSPTSA